ncbi:patatin-domain-containing protein [Dichomitus squalens LYAD-421 SS1]|uniref:Patatin-like phospholipase domain-containing protein n=1 Tax=Dichomitus squalens (strain LYAD-421) TaxID=732165 RepID=R7SZ88_DICSQ|nr:patatin-domain-containing protein [Dichomitus squalens LYAD-421 SS1]EJF61243.1 patatin-domain-containing protein [Dichomitus squalens LYAD-421 SS1]
MSQHIRSRPGSRLNGRIPLLEEDFVDERHMQQFEEALKVDDTAMLSDFTEVPNSPVISPQQLSLPHGQRVRKVSALSDFAPVNLKVRRRKRPPKTPHMGNEWLYHILRWPLLGLIFLFIAFQFGAYIAIRQVVNAKEWLSAWRGRRGVLRKRLRNAQTYQEWKDAALALDQYMHFDEWKMVDEDLYYDWKLVRKVRRSLKVFREKNDARGVLGVLETCIRNNFAGVESARLYSETFYGTKVLIECGHSLYMMVIRSRNVLLAAYIDEVEKALEYIRETPDVSNEEKKRFFKSANTNLGTSALCLSGGASFGYYHFGVVKAFLDQDLLPRVISGTSAGGLVAALVCTRTDAELKELLVPELANRITACEEPFSVWFKRFRQTGARFDSGTWARKACFFTRGSMTFREAYMRTGRILNVSVVPAERHSPTKLLNYITAPDTVIWSALLASAAVPGIMNPVVLMQKTKDGSIVPWNWGSKFKDGSLRVDIPVQALNLYFNVTHPIVSQVNPHVHLFFFAPQGSAGKPVAHSKGKGWRGNFLLSAAEQWLKLELTKNFKLIRDLDLLPQLLGQDWSSVFLQRFEGSVTIWPRTRFMDWIHILSDPDPPELERMMRIGQLVTWPKLHMIENRYRLEKQIFIGRQSVRKALHSRVHDRAVAKIESMPQEPVPQPNTGTKLPSIPVPPISSAAPTEEPLPMDTDAEAFMLNGDGERRSPPSPPQRRHSQHDLPEPGPSRLHPRRRYSRSHRESVLGSDYGGATPDPPPHSADEDRYPVQHEKQSSSHLHGGILRHLSKTSLRAAFNSLRRPAPTPSAPSKRGSVDFEQAWSEDSSTDDDDLSILSRRRSSRYPSAFELQTALQQQQSTDEDDGGQVDQDS